MALPLLESLSQAEAGREDDEAAQFCVEDVDRATIAMWVQYMRVRGVSNKTIANHHGFLSGVFKRAVMDDLIVRNPCAFTEIGSKQSERQKVILEPEEFWLIHDTMNPDSRDFIEAAVGTGARFGELTAATVGAWNSEQQILSIHEAWEAGTRKVIVWGTRRPRLARVRFRWARSSLRSSTDTPVGANRQTCCSRPSERRTHPAETCSGSCAGAAC